MLHGLVLAAAEEPRHPEVPAAETAYPAASQTRNFAGTVALRLKTLVPAALLSGVFDSPRPARIEELGEPLIREAFDRVGPFDEERPIASDAVAAAAATEVSGPSQWQVTWMPEGFSLSDYDERNVTDTPLEHMIYSDGVSSVSIFIERITGADPANTGTMNLGGVNVYARTEDGYQVTAVGEVPQATVMRMVDSVVANR